MAGTARAHLGSSKYLHVSVHEAGVTVHADLDAVDVAVELGQDPESPDLAAILRSREAIEAWLVRDLRVEGVGGPCAPEAGEPRETRRDGAPYVSVVLRYACPEGDDLRLVDDAVFDDDPRHQSFVVLEGAEVAEVLSRGRRAIELGRRPTLGDALRTFFWQGIVHLVTGLDHVLFLISLLLVAGSRTRTEGWGATFRRVGFIVTGFTVGHSVTLIAAALGWVTLPSKWVEAAIALSILLVAVDNIARPDPERRRVLPAVALAFGLIHGFGFSNVLRDLMIETSGRVATLLAFNLGIEAAQLALVAVALVPLGWMARQPWYRRGVVQLGSGFIACLAIVWVIERVMA